MRKTVFCTSQNKGADQLRGNSAADQRLCFRFTDSAIPPLPKSEISSSSCTAQFVSDLVGNPKDRFSHDAAHFSEVLSSLPKLRHSYHSLYIYIKKFASKMSHIVRKPV